MFIVFLDSIGLKRLALCSFIGGVEFGRNGICRTKVVNGILVGELVMLDAVLELVQVLEFDRDVVVGDGNMAMLVVLLVGVLGILDE